MLEPMLEVSAQLTFADTGLSQEVLTILTRRELTIPTPIQAQAIPVALTGQDVIGIAQTGTGKTLAFGLPVLERLIAMPHEHALILVPTRELALQVEESLKVIGKSLQPQIRAVCLIGGVPAYRQVKEIHQLRPRILVATPGRLRDLQQQRALQLDKVGILVLDEADRMLDMGFMPQITAICSMLPTDRQTLLFSATLAPEIAKLAETFQHNPHRVEVARAGTSATLIEQSLCYVASTEKTEVLDSILHEEQGTVLVFVRTKHGASKLARKLSTMGHRATEIHSNRTLAQRRHALDGFKGGQYRVLVATDVASRGIDVRDIAMVVNYDLPDATEDYVHRIGRTGRAGKGGKAISLATLDQRRMVAGIERLMNRKLDLSPRSLQAAEPTRQYYQNHHRGAANQPRGGYNQRPPRRHFSQRVRGSR